VYLDVYLLLNRFLLIPRRSLLSFDSCLKVAFDLPT
jgi:hypothetical protein